MHSLLVSICIPTYNGEQFIVEAIQSAIEQTYANLEIVISDDASNDETLKLIEKFKEKTKIPIHIYHHQPSSIGANWNNCIKKAKGSYIKFLFQDDVLEPTCIDEMVSLALCDDEIGLIYCKRNFIYNPNNNIHNEWIKDYGILHQSWNNLIINRSCIIEGNKLLKNMNLLKFPENKIGEPTAVLLKKECFDKVNFFDTELKQSLDIEFWYRVMKKFKVGFVDNALIKFRLHDEQASFINLNNFLNESELLEFKIYKNLFWKLNKKVKLQLFLKFNFFGKKFVIFQLILKRIKRKIKLLAD